MKQPKKRIKRKYGSDDKLAIAFLQGALPEGVTCYGNIVFGTSERLISRDTVEMGRYRLPSGAPCVMVRQDSPMYNLVTLDKLGIPSFVPDVHPDANGWQKYGDYLYKRKEGDPMVTLPDGSLVVELARVAPFSKWRSDYIERIEREFDSVLAGRLKRASIDWVTGNYFSLVNTANNVLRHVGLPLLTADEIRFQDLKAALAVNAFKKKAGDKRCYWATPEIPASYREAA